LLVLAGFIPVPPQRSKLLEDVLKVNKVTCQRRVFEGVGHDLHAAKSAEVNGLIVDWFRKHAKPMSMAVHSCVPTVAYACSRS
jgi:hypothetical protein